eukprot:11061243-Alexandrium_andersonii.AAC.1
MASPTPKLAATPGVASHSSRFRGKRARSNRAKAGPDQASVLRIASGFSGARGESEQSSLSAYAGQMKLGHTPVARHSVSRRALPELPRPE